MQPPAYRNIPTAQPPEWQGDGVTARVIAGRSHGVQGAVQRPQTLPLYLDIHLAPGARFEQLLPTRHNAFGLCLPGTRCPPPRSTPGPAGWPERKTPGCTLAGRGVLVVRVVQRGPQPAARQRSLLKANPGAPESPTTYIV